MEDKKAVHWRSQEAPKRKKRRLKNKVWMGLTITMIAIFFGILLLFAAGFVGAVTPFMPQDAYLSLKKDDMGWGVSFPAADYASDYLLEVRNAAGEQLASVELAACSGYLPLTLPEDDVLRISLTPRRSYRVFGIKTRSVAGDPMELSCRLRERTRYETSWRVDSGNKTLTVAARGGASDIYHLYLLRADENVEEISRMQYSSNASQQRGYGEMVLSFGENADFPLPEEGASLSFLLRAERIEGQLHVWEDLNEQISVRRDELLSADVMLSAEELLDNRFRLSWNETAGRGYLIQQLDEETMDWITLREYAAGEERVYESDTLPAGRYHSFRVLTQSYGSALLSQSEVRVHAGISPLLATVWTTQDMPLYTATDKKTELAVVPPCTALCVLEETGKFFKVYSAYGEAYVESDKCMINLPEYLGDNCVYDITNSYFAIYMAHDYEIRGLSGLVCVGYENVLLSDGTFLVPLLYPVAQRLAKACEATMADGLRLKIYDSFRPYITTRAIYDTTAAQLDNLAPAEPMARLSLEEVLMSGERRYMSDAMISTEPLPDKVEETEGEAAESYTITDEDGVVHFFYPDGTEYFQEDVQDMTYRQLMCREGFGLNAFLAQAGSRHNYGVAVDLTLERPETGEELVAQTNMHDLSYHSVQAANNDIADILQGYMYGVGFAGLYSEWWHFQDDEVFAELKPASVKGGVCIEGWKADDKGKRYRRADGSYVRNMSITLGDRERSFDEAGYLIED